MLRRTSFSVFCVVFAILPFPDGTQGKVQAQNRAVDMMRVDCAQFDRLRSARKRSIGVWLHGYYIGTGQRPLLDIDGIENAVSALISYCAENPDAPLVSAETSTILRGEEPPVASSEGTSGAMSGSRPRRGLRITVPSDTPRDPPRENQTAPAPSPDTPMRPRPVD